MNLTHRSNEKEILDDFELQGNDLSENLNELKKVNTWLGGYAVVRKGLRTIFEKQPTKRTWRVIDVGCGGGDTLRKVHGYFRQSDVQLKLTGIDANANAISFSQQQSLKMPEIQYLQQNIFSEEFGQNKADVYLFNLFLHHFEDGDIIKILQRCKQQGAAILINDLHRSATAYHLFRLTSKLLRFSRISRHDGLLSIKKSFTRKEWEVLLHKAGITDYSIRGCWAFRYRVIIY